MSFILYKLLRSLHHCLPASLTPSRLPPCLSASLPHCHTAFLHPCLPASLPLCSSYLPPPCVPASLSPYLSASLPSETVFYEKKTVSLKTPQKFSGKTTSFSPLDPPPRISSQPHPLTLLVSLFGRTKMAKPRFKLLNAPCLGRIPNADITAPPVWQPGLSTVPLEN